MCHLVIMAEWVAVIKIRLMDNLWVSRDKIMNMDADLCCSSMSRNVLTELIKARMENCQG